MVLTCINVWCEMRVITLAAGVLMEEVIKASCIQGFHVYQDNWTPSLASDLYLNMGQVIQEIDMLSQFVKWKMR